MDWAGTFASLRSFIRKYIAHATIRRELNPLRATFNLAVKSKKLRQTKLLISSWQKILSQQVSTVKQATVN
jgi:hypothetical protein